MLQMSNNGYISSIHIDSDKTRMSLVRYNSTMDSNTQPSDEPFAQPALNSTATPPFPATIDAPAADAQSVADQMRALVADDLAIEFVEFPKEPRQSGVVAFRGRLLRASADVFPEWLAAMKPRGYTPMLHHDPDGVSSDHVVLRVMPWVAQKVESKPLINLLLFIATIFSTLFAGALYGANEDIRTLTDALLPQNLIQGWPFAVTLLIILTAHEFGHYFAARYHKVAVSLPFFLPLPIGFGTLGAFIRMREPIPDQRKLFDIGVAGPLAGLILAVPLLFIGLSTSPMTVPEPVDGALLEGNSILYYTAKIAVFGKPLPNAITGEDVLMNRVTFAAWIGLLVTALNLLPVGQLDGGHTVFALFGRRARFINMATIGLMAVLAVLGLPQLQSTYPVLLDIGFNGWFLWLGLIIFVIGPFHPPALDDVTRLDSRRRMLGYFVILVFILTFVPVPLRPL